jgi:hypothetical protein
MSTTPNISIYRKGVIFLVFKPKLHVFLRVRCIQNRQGKIDLILAKNEGKVKRKHNYNFLKALTKTKSCPFKQCLEEIL